MSLGTPEYMSPEQATGDRQLEPASDIYSLGAVLYEMLVGDPPHMGNTAQAIIARVMIDKPASIRTVRDMVPEQVEHAVMKALAKVPADRFNSSGAFVEAAVGVGETVPVVPTRERWAPRWWMSRKLWRVGVPILGSALVIASAMLMLSNGWPVRGTSQFKVMNMRQITYAPGIEIEPVMAPDGSEVVYTAGFGLDGHLFVRDLGGGRAFPLTANLPGRQQSPRWTPDGRAIVFQESTYESTRSSSQLIPRLGGPPRTIIDAEVWDLRDNRMIYIRRNSGHDSLLVRSVEGGEETFVVSTEGRPIHSVTWSPDGTKVAYVRGNFQWVGSEWFGNVAPSSIWVVGMGDGNPRQVTDNTELNVSPAWMPDGRHLLFVSNRDGPRDIYAVRLDAVGRTRGAPERVTTGLNPHSISLSADGSTLAYSRFDYRQNIWQIAIPETGNVSVSEARQVTAGSQIVEGHRLSRDGRWLAFDSNVEGSLDIYIRPAEGEERTRLTRDPGDDFNPDFSPDGREIVFYSTRYGSRDLFVISVDGTGEVRLSDDPGDETFPSFSPDGLRIAFNRGMSAAQGGVYLISRDALGGVWSAPELLSANAGSSRWSPDGNHIVCQKGDGIWIVSLQGEERLLVDGEAMELGTSWPDWSADGRLIYFRASDPTGVLALYAIPAAGGTPREAVRFDDPTYKVSPYPFTLGDGNAYFTVRETESDIWVMELEWE
jgi:serine/threonine-protein kinase